MIPRGTHPKAGAKDPAADDVDEEGDDSDKNESEHHEIEIDEYCDDDETKHPFVQNAMNNPYNKAHEQKGISTIRTTANDRSDPRSEPTQTNHEKSRSESECDNEEGSDQWNHSIKPMEKRIPTRRRKLHSYCPRFYGWALICCGTHVLVYATP